MPKILGIDYGTKRVGVAISDDSGSVAFPRATYLNDRLLVPTLIALIRTENACVVVLGDSKDDSGKDNKIMVGVRSLAEDIQKAVAVSIHFEPEFYSSREARRLIEKNDVDAEAAAIILNSYIERTKRI